MGRRSRKRGGTDRPTLTAQPAPAPRAARPDRPAPPWAPVPLTEIAIAAGLVAMVVGFARGPDGTGTLLVGFAVCALAVFELVSREHFAGMRSHSLLLALGPVVALEAILYAAGLRGPYLLAVAVGAYGSLFFALRAQYRRARDRRALAR